MASLESQNYALRCVSQLYLSAHLNDFAIIINNDDKIPCHKTILAATSPYFEKCLFGEKDVGDELILDASKQSFLVALKFMYTGEVEFDNIDDDRLIELYPLSQSLQIKPLVDLVEHRLNDIEILTKNVGKIYEALSANNSTLLNKCWQFIEENFESVIADSDSFSKFPHDLILEIVKRYYFFAAENDIFKALVKWQKNNSILTV
ncbi:BTB/POZ domain-containing protein 9-like protein [Dinothrombium tinctorium]|uniref:BTB/POZ domain-containing protein 9-like protein n=1 Tax=Dinothrombium tinctorium TaxID=1965070 RepID=A0A3S3QCZ8_9ACAR|nr:BTB/POZ domain-containing protein 9-like protein [Dinothrombium tinctorium]